MGSFISTTQVLLLARPENIAGALDLHCGCTTFSSQFSRRARPETRDGLYARLVDLPAALLAAALVPGVDYSYFCSYPGHSTFMRGRVMLADKAKLAVNR